jgi:hypothetical protein
MINNKWRLAFWICLIILLLISGFAVYRIIDQGVTITYLRDGCENTENDLNSLIYIINAKDYSKNTIKQNLESHRYFDMIDFDSDSVGLERVKLIFKNDTLNKIEKQW